MISAILRVRFIGSLTCAGISALYVVFYTGMSFSRFRYDHPDNNGLTVFNQFMVDHSYVGWTIPAFIAVCGLLSFRCRARKDVLLEATIQIGWILSLGWIFVSILSWQIQNIPVFSGGHLHY
jgi:hypothetical protein